MLETLQYCAHYLLTQTRLFVGLFSTSLTLLITNEQWIITLSVYLKIIIHFHVSKEIFSAYK